MAQQDMTTKHQMTHDDVLTFLFEGGTLCWGALGTNCNRVSKTKNGFCSDCQALVEADAAGMKKLVEAGILKIAVA